MRKHVLVIDDDIILLKNVESLLISNKYKVTLANDVVDAIEKLQFINPDLILLDIMMPELTGFDFFEIMKKVDIHIPIICLTGSSDDNCISAAAYLGAKDYICKPFIPEILLNAVKNHCL